MDKRDYLGQEIKDIMKEETFGLTLSESTLDDIFKSRKKTKREKISEFLNREVEVPLAPAIIGMVALFAISIIPGEMLKSYEERVIDIGGSQVIIREGKEVGKNESKD